MKVETTAHQNANHSKQSHTPGPWVVNGEGCLVALLRGATDITAPSESVFHAVTDEELAANARLVAAAPALLADANENDAAFAWLAEQMNSITDNAKHWSTAQLEALAQDLRIGIESNQKRTRAAVAAAEGR